MGYEKSQDKKRVESVFSSNEGLQEAQDKKQAECS
jgi:hypothetical protein